MQFKQIVGSAIAGLVVVANAHPGEHETINHAADLIKREYKADVRRGLEKCADKLEARGITARALARRQATANKHSKRNILVRDTDTVLNTTHLGSSDITLNTSEDLIFADNGTCVLNPEGEIGPFWVKGEFIRSNLTDGELGVPIIIDGQFLDVETCEPIVDLYWDLWNCNSTGVYSGVVQSGNGNGDDLSNINSTFLRGIQKTDSDGVVQFQTVFPGHYSGRATHMHTVAHINATVLPNNTLTGGDVAHIGQLFWDQDLITQVEATYPYNTNTISITTNADDRVFGLETADSTADPVINYVMLGDDLSDGLFAWITIAVNVSATYDTSYSFALTSAGGVAVSSDAGDDAAGGAGGNGTTPSGSMPSGAAPSGF